MKDSRIQTFDDLEKYLIDHPGNDDEFCRLLEISGYLSGWKIERTKNPWQYELDLMCEGPADLIEEYCWSVLAGEEVGPNRYIVNRGGYMLLSRQFNLKFFRTMFGLYDILARLHHKRVSVAAQWLKIKGLFTPSVMSYLVPHTPEWFAALDQWDPPKAIMTRKIIELAGTAEVCSVCGDDPAIDYCLEGVFCLSRKWRIGLVELVG